MSETQKENEQGHSEDVLKMNALQPPVIYQYVKYLSLFFF